MNLVQLQKQIQLASESGVDKEYAMDFESLSGIELVAFKPDITRIAEKNNVEPIGDKTGLPSKPHTWEPNRMIGLWEDKSDNVPTTEETGCSKEEMAEKGFHLVDSVYKKVISSDITTLATYGYYVVEEEQYCLGNIADGPVRLKSAYNFFGDYIGTQQDAEYLCKEKGISPELAHPDNKVCSIGYSKKEGLWYGWSHRAIYGFCEGSWVDMSSSGYRPSTLDDAVCRSREWHTDISDDSNPRNTVIVTPEGETDTHFKVRVQKSIYHAQGVKNPSPNPVVSCDEVELVPKGKGTWMAETSDDAKQMAIDFAQSVSTCEVSSVNLEGLLSSISATKNPLDYAWYRYTATKAKHYNNHHRSMDLSVETNEKFGIRFSTRNKSVYLVMDTDLANEFKLSEREAKLLLKNAKGFRGKVEGIRVIAGKGNIDQVTSKTNRIPSHTGKAEALEKPVTQKKLRAKNVSYFGFYRPSVTQEVWEFVEETSVAEVKKILDSRLKAFNKKELGQAAYIVRAEGSVSKDLSSKLGSKKKGTLRSIVFNSVLKRVKVLDKNYTPKGVTFYDETIPVPHHDERTFSFQEPVFYGNEDALLKELQEAVIRDTKFTAIFKGDGDRLDRKIRVRRTASGVAYVLFMTNTVNKQFIKEAQHFVERLQSDLGKIVGGKVQVNKDESITVMVFLRIKKTTKEQQDRSFKLKALFDNSMNRSSSNKRIIALLDDRNKLASRISKMAKSDKDPSIELEYRNLNKELDAMNAEINKLSNSLSKDKVIVYKAPMYSVKAGKVFLPAEIDSIDIPRARITASIVRGNRSDATREVAEVYSLDGSVKII